MSKSRAIPEYHLVSSFEDIRGKLLDESLSECLDKPLAFWALPNDRRLPLAFMTRTLRDLLDTPFHELYATPGVGRKKIRSLVDLLQRASQGQLPIAFSHVTSSDSSVDGESHASNGAAPCEFDPTNISEATWSQWRAMIASHGLGQEPLGRFASSLQDIPRVIWSTPLAAYSDLTLADLRALKTYGEKRVNAILDVFGSIQAILGAIDVYPHLGVRIAPRFALEIEAWMARVLEEGQPINKEEIRCNLIDPLVRQILVDAGEHVASLAKTRLTVSGDDVNIRQVAGQMGLTRARIYQLLDDIQTIVRIRWPAGGDWYGQLRSNLDRAGAQRSAMRLLTACAGVFFASGSKSSSRVVVHARARLKSRRSSRSSQR